MVSANTAAAECYFVVNLFTLRVARKGLTILEIFFITKQASTLTQNDTGPVGPVTPSICWSYKIFTGPTFFFNITRKNIA